MQLKCLAGLALLSLAIAHHSMVAPELESIETNTPFSSLTAITLETPMTIVTGLRG